MSFPKIVFVTSTESIGSALSNCQFHCSAENCSPSSSSDKINDRPNRIIVSSPISSPISSHISNASLGRCLSKTRLFPQIKLLIYVLKHGNMQANSCGLLWTNSHFTSFVFSPHWSSLHEKKHSFFSSNVRS